MNSLLVVQSFIKWSYCQFKFISHILEENLFLKYLPSFLEIWDIALLNNDNPKWSQNSKLMILRMIPPAITIKTHIVVSALLAFKSVCLYRIIVAFITSYVLMHIVFQLKLNTHFLDRFLLFLDFFFHEFLIGSQHSNFSSK